MTLNIRRFLLWGVAIVLGPRLLIPSLPAASGSGCLYHCETPVCADFGNHSQFCVDTRARCLAYCSRADAYQAWGAIAYSKKDKAYGSGYNFDTKDEAKKTAMNNCRKHGVDCVVWIYFNRECGAIAVDGNYTGWGTGNARYWAKDRALKECAAAGGRNCQVLDSVCSQ